MSKSTIGQVSPGAQADAVHSSVQRFRTTSNLFSSPCSFNHPVMFSKRGSASSWMESVAAVIICFLNLSLAWLQVSEERFLRKPAQAPNVPDSHRDHWRNQQHRPEFHQQTDGVQVTEQRGWEDVRHDEQSGHQVGCTATRARARPTDAIVLSLSKGLSAGWRCLRLYPCRKGTKEFRS